MTTSYSSFASSALAAIAISEAKAAMLPFGDARWIMVFRAHMDRRILIDMWDDDDANLVVLADAFVAFVGRHGLHAFDAAIADYQRRPSPSSADHLFYEVGFC